MKIIRQPKYKPGTKYRPQEFSIQEPADPRPGSAQEQKEWPLCNTWKPHEPEPTPAEQLPQPPTSAE